MRFLDGFKTSAGPQQSLETSLPVIEYSVPFIEVGLEERSWFLYGLGFEDDVDDERFF